MKSLLKKLTALKTTEGNIDNFGESLELLSSFFGKEVTIERFYRNKIPSIVISKEKKRDYKIILNAHVDVVSAAYQDAFNPKIKKGKLYARGASDMKGPLVGMVYALGELLEDGKGDDVALIVTCDEEIGGFNGIRYLLDEEGFSAKVAFIPDGGENWQICVEEKGFWHIEITSKGKEAHGAYLWRGGNAIETLLEVYSRIRNFFIENWGKVNPNDNWKPTVNLGSLVGGESPNKVPDKAMMKLDIRYPGEIKKEFIFENILKTAKEFDCSCKTLVKGAPNYNKETNKFIKIWKHELRINNIKSKFIKAHGGSDARFFSKNGIPVLMSKPKASDPHVENEWIDLESLEVFKQLIKEWIIKVNKII